MTQTRPKAPFLVVGALVLGLGFMAVVQTSNPVLIETRRAVESLRAGTPPNPMALIPGSSAPVIGQVWNPVVDHTTFVPDAVFDLLVITDGATNYHLGAVGTLLVDLDRGVVSRLAPAGVPFELTIPHSPEFVGSTFSAQAASVDSFGFQLTNAIDIIIGAPDRPMR